MRARSKAEHDVNIICARGAVLVAELYLWNRPPTNLDSKLKVIAWLKLKETWPTHHDMALHANHGLQAKFARVIHILKQF